jgi:hypothetical protein
VQFENLGTWDGLGNVNNLKFKGKYMHCIAIQRSYFVLFCMLHNAFLFLSLQVLKTCGLMVDVGKSYVVQQR